MPAVLEGVEHAYDVSLVFRIKVSVELAQHLDFYHSLVIVRRLVFDDLDGYDLLGAVFLTAKHLAKGPHAQRVENRIGGIRHAGNELVVDSANEVVVFIIRTAIVNSLSRVGQQSPRKPRKCLKIRVAFEVRFGYATSQRR